LVFGISTLFGSGYAGLGESYAYDRLC
jgi:hypothetical protein